MRAGRQAPLEWRKIMHEGLHTPNFCQRSRNSRVKDYILRKTTSTQKHRGFWNQAPAIVPPRLPSHGYPRMATLANLPRALILETGKRAYRESEAKPRQFQSLHSKTLMASRPNSMQSPETRHKGRRASKNGCNRTQKRLGIEPPPLPAKETEATRNAEALCETA